MVLFLECRDGEEMGDSSRRNSKSCYLPSYSIFFSSLILAFIFAFSDFLHQPSTRTRKAFDDAKISRLGDLSEYSCICQTMCHLQ